MSLEEVTKRFKPGLQFLLVIDLVLLHRQMNSTRCSARGGEERSD